jgi:phosphate starvation-inducible protein PhoH
MPAKQKAKPKTVNQVPEEPKEINKKDLIANIITKRPKEKFLNENQKKFYQLLKEKEITICSGSAGTGKAQPIDAKIITPTGMVNMGDIVVGDFVIDENGNPVEVIAVHPQGEKPIYRVLFNDGTFTESCEDHLWYTKTYYERNARKRVGENRLNKRISSPKDYSVKTLKKIKETLTTKRGDKNHSIPVTKPVQFNEQKLLIDPYILGVLIGDGGLTQYITFTCADNEIVENIKALIPENIHLNKPKGKYKYSIIGENGKNEFLNELNQLNLLYKKSENKFIPYEYMFNSIENRISLLQGLMDTDGTVDSKSGSVFFTTTSKKLADDMVFLVNSLGGVVKRWLKQPFYRNKEGEKIMGLLAYELCICLPNEITPFRLKRKLKLVKPKSRYLPKRYITNVEFIGNKEAKCITVNSEKGLYLTDNFIVTHNSHLTLRTAIELILDPTTPYEKIIIIRPAVEGGESRLGSLPGNEREKMNPYMYASFYLLNKILGEGVAGKLEFFNIIEVMSISFIRGISVENSILLLEESQNCTPAEMKLILTRIGHNSKFFIIGDVEQSDKFKQLEKSGLYDAMKRLQNIDEIGLFEFTEEDIVRNPIISKILKRYQS